MTKKKRTAAQIFEYGEEMGLAVIDKSDKIQKEDSRNSLERKKY